MIPIYHGEGLATSSLKDPEKTLAKPKNWTWEISPFFNCQKMPLQEPATGLFRHTGNPWLQDFLEMHNRWICFLPRHPNHNMNKVVGNAFVRNFGVPYAPPVVVCEHGDTSLDFGICPTVSEERKLSPSFALTQNHPLRYLMAIFRGRATWHPMEPVLALMCADFYVPLSDSRACTHYMHLRGACA